MEALRTCTKCGEELPTSEFYKRKDGGINRKCKHCVKKYQRDRRKNPEAKNIIKNCRKKYYEKNKDKIKKAYKEYYEKVKQGGMELKRERENKYYHDNKKEIRERIRKYRKENPQIVFNNNAKRRSQLIGKAILKEEWMLIMESNNWKCFYCNCNLNKENRSLDHWIPLARGGEHVISNLLPACRSCNSSKNDKPYHEWQGHLKQKEN